MRDAFHWEELHKRSTIVKEPIKTGNSSYEAGLKFEKMSNSINLYRTSPEISGKHFHWWLPWLHVIVYR